MSINQSINQIYFSPHNFLGTIKRMTLNIMLLFIRKLNALVKFAGQEKDLNSSAKELDQQQNNLTS